MKIIIFDVNQRELLYVEYDLIKVRTLICQSLPIIIQLLVKNMLSSNIKK